MQRHRSYGILVIMGGIIIGLIAGCATHGALQQSEMDTPAHHYQTGMHLLDQVTIRREILE
mgnify:CR=1 FL=1